MVVVSRGCVVAGSSFPVVLVSCSTVVEDVTLVVFSLDVVVSVVLGSDVDGNCVLVVEGFSVVLLVLVAPINVEVVLSGNEVVVLIVFDVDKVVVGNCGLEDVVSSVVIPAAVVASEIGTVIVSGNEVAFVVVCNGAVVLDLFEGNTVVLVLISGKVAVIVAVPGAELAEVAFEDVVDVVIVVEVGIEQAGPAHDKQPFSQILKRIAKYT